MKGVKKIIIYPLLLSIIYILLWKTMYVHISLDSILYLYSILEKAYIGDLMVQWLGLLAPNVGGPGLVPGQGTVSPRLQLRPRKTK